MKKSICFAAILLLTAGLIFAETWARNGELLEVEDAPEDNAFNRYDSALGITWLIGQDVPSMQYQHWITPGFGFTLNTGAYYEPEAYDTEGNLFRGAQINFNAFGQLQWGLYTASNSTIDTRLYAWILGGIVLEQNSNTNYGLLTNGIAGAGFGFDIDFLKHISIPLEFGYLGTAPDSPSISMVANMGIRYRF